MPEPSPRHFYDRVARAVGAADGLPIDPDLDPDDPAEPSVAHRPLAHLHRAHPAALAAIATGGFLGAWGRYELGLAWPQRAGTFPTTTFVINTSGAFLLGLVFTALAERFATRRRGRAIRLFACVGVLGAWTTMSTLAVEADTLVRRGSVALAALYLGATVGAGLAAVTAGMALGRRHSRPRRAPSDLDTDPTADPTTVVDGRATTESRP